MITLFQRLFERGHNLRRLSISQNGIDLAIMLVCFLTLQLEADPIPGEGGAESFAWAANVGWIDFNASVESKIALGRTFLRGQVWAANIGWIDLGNGTPLNGHSYGNESSGDFGVNCDDWGNLSGFAYAANVGWINFGWAAASNNKRARFDPQSGAFEGYAWSANIGWINLDSGLVITERIALKDSDTDKMDDSWELRSFGDLTTAGVGTDSDKDGILDSDEFLGFTNALDPRDPADLVFCRIEEVDFVSNYITLVFKPAEFDRQYRIEFNNVLEGPWTDSGLGSFFADPGLETKRVIPLPTDDSRFYRVMIEKKISE